MTQPFFYVEKMALEAAIRVECTNSRQCADKLRSVLLVSDNKLSVTETYGSFFFSSKPPNELPVYSVGVWDRPAKHIQSVDDVILNSWAPPSRTFITIISQLRNVVMSN